jgi:hypothetical protein
MRIADRRTIAQGVRPFQLEAVMHEFFTRTSTSCFALALSLGFVATASEAQQPPAAPAVPAAPAMCTAQAEPAQVQAGQAAVRLTFTLSSGIGAITGVEAPEGSGLALAAAQDIPRAAMANPTPNANAADASQEAKPIELAAESNTVSVWLKTAGVQAGEFELKLKGENDTTCNTKVRVAAG